MKIGLMTPPRPTTVPSESMYVEYGAYADDPIGGSRAFQHLSAAPVAAMLGTLLFSFGAACIYSSLGVALTIAERYGMLVSADVFEVVHKMLIAVWVVDGLAIFVVYLDKLRLRGMLPWFAENTSALNPSSREAFFLEGVLGCLLFLPRAISSLVLFALWCIVGSTVVGGLILCLLSTLVIIIAQARGCGSERRLDSVR